MCLYAGCAAMPCCTYVGVKRRGQRGVREGKRGEMCVCMLAVPRCHAVRTWE